MGKGDKVMSSVDLSVTGLVSAGAQAPPSAGPDLETPPSTGSLPSQTGSSPWTDTSRWWWWTDCLRGQLTLPGGRMK